MKRVLQWVIPAAVSALLVGILSLIGYVVYQDGYDRGYADGMVMKRERPTKPTHPSQLYTGDKCLFGMCDELVRRWQVDNAKWERYNREAEQMGARYIVAMRDLRSKYGYYRGDSVETTTPLAR